MNAWWDLNAEELHLEKNSREATKVAQNSLSADAAATTATRYFLLPFVVNANASVFN